MGWCDIIRSNDNLSTPFSNFLPLYMGTRREERNEGLKERPWDSG